MAVRSPKEEHPTKRPQTLLALALIAAGLSAPVHAQGVDKKMSFFATSVNPGKGADLGGLAGADKYCQTLGDAAGAGKRTWRAYLSTTASGGAKSVNAR